MSCTLFEDSDDAFEDLDVAADRQFIERDGHVLPFGVGRSKRSGHAVAM
jgi:D-arabinose 5-phosphate isomerase GutQ